MPPTPLVDWIALNLLTAVGPTPLRTALERFGDDPGRLAYRADPRVLCHIRGFTEKKLGFLLDARKDLRKRAEQERQRCERLGIRLLPFRDRDYPAALHDLADAPILLYVKGELKEGLARIAVIGSRAATAYGKRIAGGLGSGLASRAIEVVSGGARGIDSAAHFGALEARGRTTAVIGSGLLQPYPPENGKLFEKIAASGALISEFPLEERPLPRNFLRRNRLISGLSAAVVVVEAAERSGSLSTVGHALAQDREVLAVPGPVTSIRSVGCHRLIQQGAKLVQNIEDILEELSPMYRGAAGPDPAAEIPPNLEGLSRDEKSVLNLLDPVEPLQLDDLADRAPFGVARLQAALFGLEIRGAVEQTPGKYYLLRPRKGA